MHQNMEEHKEGHNTPIDYLDELPRARPHIHGTRKFPEGFLWGAATSSHQVEGDCVNNDWYEWEQEPGHIADGTVSGKACDHYNRYEEDFDIAKSLHNNAHRFSIEWSRIEPEEGRWDMKELQHYRSVLLALRKRGMKSMVTIWHFTLPGWFAERGGWEAGDSVKLFGRYAEFLARELGDLVDIWITINEPMVYLSQSYSVGVWPPGKNSIRSSIRVFRRLARAHRAAYRAIHRVLDGGRSKALVGFANNVITFEPYRRHSFMDNVFIHFAGRFFNHQFMRWTKRHHDFIGINYYFHYRVKCVPKDVKHFFYEVHPENRPVSDLGWEINAQGFFDAIMTMRRYRLPIYITENGLASADDGKRPRVLINMVMEMYHAIRAGADVRGYFHWSLLDNYEWEKGFSGRFGLVAIDYKTLKRAPRRSAYVYADICRENGLPHTLLKFIGHGVRW